MCPLPTVTITKLLLFCASVLSTLTWRRYVRRLVAGQVSQCAVMLRLAFRRFDVPRGRLFLFYLRNRRNRKEKRSVTGNCSEYSLGRRDAPQTHTTAHLSCSWSERAIVFLCAKQTDADSGASTLPISKEGTHRTRGGVLVHAPNH